MNKKQVDFLVKFLQMELINISDACDYETYGTDIDRVEARKAVEQTIKLVKAQSKKKKPKSKKL